ncbi:hypothetical protein T12_182 [Trichinella patagoniensis]|uniref:Uncharacterized protein n=1 Tax=Trichinella patagoniensis TaxID=990121 RepID=A0A0V0YXN0_9BILA|nr:hypothetical protein T12_182 [Trichinella patagoniensis]
MNSKEFNEMIVFLMIPKVAMVYDRLSGVRKVNEYLIIMVKMCPIPKINHPGSVSGEFQ